MKEWLLPLCFGLAAGILSAWGIGGGTLLLLGMTLFLGLAQQEAQAINLLYFLPTAAAALLYHRKNGYLRPSVLRLCIPAGVCGALLGSFAAGYLPTEWLRRPFGIFLLLSAWSLWKQTKGAR